MSVPKYRNETKVETNKYAFSPKKREQRRKIERTKDNDYLIVVYKAIFVVCFLLMFFPCDSFVRQKKYPIYESFVYFSSQEQNKGIKEKYLRVLFIETMTQKRYTIFSVCIINIKPFN